MRSKKLLTALLLALSALTAICLTGCGIHSHIYDSAKIKTVTDSSTGTKITYSYVSIPADDATKENLTDYYFNYFEEKNIDYGIIRYKDSGKGVYIGSYTDDEDDLYIDKGVTLLDNASIDPTKGYKLRYKPDEKKKTLKLVRTDAEDLEETAPSSQTEEESTARNSSKKKSTDAEKNTSNGKSRNTSEGTQTETQRPPSQTVLADTKSVLRSYFPKASMPSGANSYTIKTSGNTTRVDGKIATDGKNYQYFTLKLKYNSEYTKSTTAFLQVGSTIFTN